MCLLIYKQYDDGAYTQKKIITVTSKFKQSIYRLHWVDLLCEGRAYTLHTIRFSVLPRRLVNIIRLVQCTQTYILQNK